MTTPLQAARLYVDLCTVGLNERDFASLCSENVRVSNQTNGELTVSFQGRDAVVKAFSEKVFNNTRNFEIMLNGFSASEKGVAVFLDLKADKLSEDGNWIRTHFIERTYLTFEKVDLRFKLLSIDMKVTKETV